VAAVYWFSSLPGNPYLQEISYNKTVQAANWTSILDTCYSQPVAGGKLGWLNCCYCRL